jgi:hypothetical protein
MTEQEKLKTKEQLSYTKKLLGNKIKNARLAIKITQAEEAIKIREAHKRNIRTQIETYLTDHKDEYDRYMRMSDEEIKTEYFEKQKEILQQIKDIEASIANDYDSRYMNYSDNYRDVPEIASKEFFKKIFYYKNIINLLEDKDTALWVAFNIIDNLSSQINIEPKIHSTISWGLPKGHKIVEESKD